MDGFPTGTGHRGQRNRHRSLWPAFTVTSPDSDGLARSAPLTTESRYPFSYGFASIGSALHIAVYRFPRYPPLALVAHAPRPDAMRGCYRSGPAHAPTPDSDILRPHQPRLGDAPKLPIVFVP
jgi:hypothetical protein